MSSLFNQFCQFFSSSTNTTSVQTPTNTTSIKTPTNSTSVQSTANTTSVQTPTNGSVNYKSKLYEVIRNNGGWNNWNMEIIDFFNCKDHSEARQKEQEYFVSLNATLNSVEPFPTQKTGH